MNFTLESDPFDTVSAGDTAEMAEETEAVTPEETVASETAERAETVEPDLQAAATAAEPEGAEPIDETRPAPAEIVEASPVEAAPAEIVAAVPEAVTAEPVLAAEPPQEATAEEVVPLAEDVPVPVTRPSPPRPAEPVRERRVAETPARPKARAPIAKRPEPAKPSGRQRTVAGNRGTSQSDTTAAASGAGSARRGGAGRSGAGQAAVSNYKGRVQAQIVRAAARRTSRAGGDATVSFTILASGAVANVRVSARSGSAAVDAAAVALVRSAAPFPPPPDVGSLSMSLPLNFKGS